MKHFKTRAEAKKWRDQKAPRDIVFKKIKGQKNRLQKPFVVDSAMGFLNLALRNQKLSVGLYQKIYLFPDHKK